MTCEDLECEDPAHRGRGSHRGLRPSGLEAEGYGVRVEADGRSGLDAALTGDADLVVLDLGLPSLRGEDVWRVWGAQPNASTDVVEAYVATLARRLGEGIIESSSEGYRVG